MEHMRLARKVDLPDRHMWDQVEHFQVSWTINIVFSLACFYAVVFCVTGTKLLSTLDMFFW